MLARILAAEFADQRMLLGWTVVNLVDLVVQRPVVVDHSEQQEPAREEVEDAREDLAQIEAVDPEHPEECEQ